MNITYKWTIYLLVVPKWLKQLAKELLKHSELALTKAIQAGELLEVST